MVKKLLDLTDDPVAFNLYSFYVIDLLARVNISDKLIDLNRSYTCGLRTSRLSDHIVRTSTYDFSS
ncbi:hypothetical protein [Thermoactinomyces sp. DSM 45892]|uniref:hypothetical protein n=1 Tax=Thermoactinomyces sp. DSM 45892 TaxID=1882753 RepID=UPI00089D905B|nr:hypothetical protein [Thermoactinomyces sp. DSM 45892]SDZ24213.1 hypothetical protein SAMN05444416_11748 [Thermoactinomyces sp. DSM 45892]